MLKLIPMVLLTLLTGCAAMNPPDAFYNAQSATRVARMALEAQPKLRISCEPTCTFALLEYRGEVSESTVINEGHTAGVVAAKGLGVVESALVPAAMIIGLKTIAENMGTTTVNGDGNEITSNNREYNIATGDENRMDSADTYDQKANFNNPVDNSSTATPTVVDKEVVVVTDPSIEVVRPEVVIVNDPSIEVVKPEVVLVN